MHFQPAHFRLIDLLAEQAGLFVHFLALRPVDRGVEVGIGELRIERGLFLVPLGQLAFQLLDFLEQWAALGEDRLPVGLGFGALVQALGLFGGDIGFRGLFGAAWAASQAA